MNKRAERQTLGLCVVEGVRAVGAALASSCEVDTVYVSESASAREDLTLAMGTEVPVKLLADGVIEHVSDTVTPQPVLATVRIPRVDFDVLGEAALCVVLAGVSDPGNAGTIVRAAEGAGAAAVVFCTGSTDPFSSKVIRASAGAVFQVPVIQGGTPREVLDGLGERGVRRLGTAADGGTAYDRVDWHGAIAVVLGNEAWGVPPEVRTAIDGWVTIPMAGTAESLNVAMAGSVLLFEAARQRSRP